MVKVLSLLIILSAATGWFMITEMLEIDKLNKQVRMQGDIIVHIVDIISLLADELTKNTHRLKQLTLMRGFKVTGYSNDPISINVRRWRDGYTATNRKVHKGICASDWRVLPVGSRIWISGYGWCEVQDRGSAVKGRHIDMFFDSRQKALLWGVKNMDILVIGSK